MLSTLIIVPGPPVQAHPKEQVLGLHRKFKAHLVTAVDVGTLPRLPLGSGTGVGVRKAKPHLVPNRRLHERAKGLNSDEAMKAKTSRAAAGSLPPQAFDQTRRPK